MLDCDRAERNAVMQVFPDAFILLCEFHVKQAWRRALGKRLGLESPAFNLVRGILVAWMHYKSGPLHTGIISHWLTVIIIGLRQCGLSNAVQSWVLSYVKRWIACKVIGARDSCHSNHGASL